MIVPLGAVPVKEAFKVAVELLHVESLFTIISKLFMVSFGKPTPPMVAPLGGN